MTDNNLNPETYSKEYFAQEFPPNHNPLIGSMREDTLCNVRDALHALNELNETQELRSFESAQVGCIF